VPDLLERLKAALADRYAVEAEIGRGGMAVVFRAEDLRHHRKVAVKVLRPELSVTLAADRFLNEIALVAGLEHPHILTLIDSGEAGDLLYYIMPYVAGESLRHRLDREGRLPVAEAVRIASEVADGLDFAHRQGVIHRDVKPGNILLSDRHAVITDFGIARAITVAQGGRVTSTGLGVGTPLFASPEQTVGSRDLDGRTDIYSLGCVLYEMLSGEVPLSGPTPQATYARRIAETPPPLHPIRATVPPLLDQAIARAIAPLPADRWSTPAQFAEALLSCLTVEAAQGHKDVKSMRPRVWRGVVGFAAIVAGLYLGALLLAPSQSQDPPWEIVEGLNEIERLLGDRHWKAAYIIAQQLDDVIESDSVRTAMWSEVSRPVSFRTEPPGALVFRRDYAPEDAEWEELGHTPLEVQRFPMGVSRVRLELEGYRARELANSSGGFSRLARHVLDPEEAVPAGMARVDGDSVWLDVPGLPYREPLAIGDYLIATHEVTNREYKAFVDAGGYRDPTCWRHDFVRGERTLSFAEAMDEFIDQTGRPGPSTWAVGSYADGAGDLPVGGVGWHEADAFACFVGKQLPTVYHWYFEALHLASNYVVPLSNYHGDGASPVGQHQGVTKSGTYDMAGNVREWTQNADGENRYILGGGWDDPKYMFRDPATLPTFDRSPSNGIRLAVFPDTTNLELARAPIERAFRDFYAESPASADEYSTYRQWYSYDRSPLNAVVVGADTSEVWIREQIEIDAADAAERLTAYVFIPRAVKAPYQTVVFFPGSWGIYAESFDEQPGTDIYGFIPQSGRAFVFPVYKGTFERGSGLSSDVQDETNLYREHVIRWAEDLGRTIDYLEIRPDIDTEQLGYLGYSWGGVVGGIMTAIEPRFKASVLWAGGLLMQPTQPMVDPFNFLPRVTVPTLMIHGRYDSLLPLETSAQPFFEHLGTTPEDKRLYVVEDASHSLYRRNQVIRETLDWYDRYLGAVN
jgi:dienelactone hydrolase